VTTRCLIGAVVVMPKVMTRHLLVTYTAPIRHHGVDAFFRCRDGDALVTHRCCISDVLVMWGRMCFCGIRREKLFTQYAIRSITPNAKIAMDKNQTVRTHRQISVMRPTIEVGTAIIYDYQVDGKAVESCGITSGGNSPSCDHHKKSPNREC